MFSGSRLGATCFARALRNPNRRTRLQPSGCGWYEPEAQLDTVVVRPDERTLVLMCSAVVRVLAQYPPEELAQCAGEASWGDMGWRLAPPTLGTPGTSGQRWSSSAARGRGRAERAPRAGWRDQNALHVAARYPSDELAMVEVDVRWG